MRISQAKGGVRQHIKELESTEAKIKEDLREEPKIDKSVFATLKFYWKDPVISKLIATSIIAIFGLLVGQKACISIRNEISIPPQITKNYSAEIIKNNPKQLPVFKELNIYGKLGSHSTRLCRMHGGIFWKRWCV